MLRRVTFSFRNLHPSKQCLDVEAAPKDWRGELGLRGSHQLWLPQDEPHITQEGPLGSPPSSHHPLGSPPRSPPSSHHCEPTPEGPRAQAAPVPAATQEGPAGGRDGRACTGQGHPDPSLGRGADPFQDPHGEALSRLWGQGTSILKAHTGL